MTTTQRDRKLLKLLIEMSENHIRPIIFEQLKESALPLGYDETELLMCLSDLQASKLITARVPPSTNIPIDIHLTFEGLRFFTFKNERIKNFILASVFLPILVSIITTLTTIWLKSLFHQ